MFEVSEAKRWLVGGYNHGHIANLPYPIAMEMALGFRFTAERFYEIGSPNRLTEPDQLIPTALVDGRAFVDAAAGLAGQHGPHDAPPEDPVRTATGLPNPLEVIYSLPSSLASPTPSDITIGALETEHWHRNRETLASAVSVAQAGDINAYKRIEKTRELIFRRTHRLGGVPKLKEHPQHAEMFLVGLELGLERLTAEELADCFDEPCDCGDLHDADALKKQRARLQRAIKNVNETDRSKCFDDITLVRLRGLCRSGRTRPAASQETEGNGNEWNGDAC